MTSRDNIATVDGELRAPIVSAYIKTSESDTRKWYLFGNVQSYTAFLECMESYGVKVHSIHPLEGKPSVTATDRR